MNRWLREALSSRRRHTTHVPRLSSVVGKTWEPPWEPPQPCLVAMIVAVAVLVLFAHFVPVEVFDLAMMA